MIPLNRIKNILLIEKSGSLSEKTIKGSVWLLLLRVVDQFLRFVKIIILARILSPNDFGLFGASLAVFAMAESFSQTGFQQALIQKKENVKNYLNTAWTIQIIRGLILSIILFITAPLAANFFKTPQIALMIRILALSTFCSSFTNIGLVYFQKELQMHKYFMYQSIGGLLDFLATVTIVLIWPTVWALIFGFLMGNIFKIIISYKVHPYRPRFKISFTKAKELFNFGKWIFSSNIIGFFILQGDSIFIGKLLGMASLGFYQVAYKIASFLNTEIIFGTLFPAYSKIQDNKDALKKAYFNTLKISFFIFMPMAGGIFVISNDIIKIFFGDKWLPAAVPLKFLIWSSLLWGIVTITAPLIQAVGKPKIETFWNGVRFALLLLFLYPFVAIYGISGAALVVLLSVFVSSVGFVLSALKIIGAKIKDFWKIMAIPFISTIIMILIVWQSDLIFFGRINLFYKIILGGLIYFLLMYIAEKKNYYQITPLFKRILFLFKE